MDLLNDLEDRSDRTSFRIQYDPQSSISDLPNLTSHEESQDILKKVQRKLAAINEIDHPNQEDDVSDDHKHKLLLTEVNEASSQDLELGDSLLFAPADTQILLPQLDVEDAEISYTQQPTQTFPALLPQLDVEDADIDSLPTQDLPSQQASPQQVPLDLPDLPLEIDLPEKLSQTLPEEFLTKKPTKPTIQNGENSELASNMLFVDQEDDDDDEEEEAHGILSVAQRRALKLKKLVEQKRADREQKQQENEELMADISHTSLTDEENDYFNQDDDYVVVEGKKSQRDAAKKFEEAQQFLQTQKRIRNIQPVFQKKNVYTTDMLAAAFEQETADPEPLIESDKESSTGLKSDKMTPITSPLKTAVGPINLYVKNLKNQILSSPTKHDDNEQVLVDLDDSDLDLEPNSPTQIPKLSKDKILHIKQKFMIRNLAKKEDEMLHLPKSIRNKVIRPEGGTSLLETLQKSNKSQLQKSRQQDPLRETLMEMEKDDEEMGTLLEREMERVRNIRKREKILEKAKSVLMSGKLEDDMELQESEVQESDYSEDDEDEDEEDDEDDDEEEKDDKEEEEEEEKEEEEEEVEKQDADADDQIGVNANFPESISQNHRKNDSYMFGAKPESDIEESISTTKEEFITTLETTSPGSSDIPPTRFYNQRNDDNDEVKLIERDESQNSDLSHLKVLSFQDLPNDHSTQFESTQVDFVPTQPDETSNFDATQVIQNRIHPESEEDDEEDAITPGRLRKARKMLQRNTLSSLKEEQEEEGEDEEVQNAEESDTQNDQEETNPKLDDEENKRLMKQYEDKIRRQELKLRKRRRAMERLGVKNVLEAEAEESEDEWHGIGGAEGELSDQADSEDEKMIDNDFNIDLNDQEVKKKFMEQFQLKDKQELEKLLDDVKNHKLTKRVANRNGFDIELSDEEDELLSAYRRQRVEEQRARLLENKKLQALVSNDKSLAFFSSIQDEAILISLDDEEDERSSSDEESLKDDDERALEEELAESKKRTIRINEEFVQKQLSFLTNSSNNQEIEYNRLQRISARQHGHISEDDFEDLQSIKRRCLDNLSYKSSQSFTSIANEQGTDVDEESDEEGIFVSRKPSMVKSFLNVERAVQVKTGKSFSGVTISKQYKAATGTKSSIAYMSSKAKKVTSLKDKRISKSVAGIKSRSMSLFGSSGFE